MNRFTISPEALADLEGIREWIARDNPTRAASFLEELNAQFGRLATAPQMGRSRKELGEGVRSRVFGNFVVFYRQTGLRIEVVRVMHGRRDFRRGLS